MTRTLTPYEHNVLRKAGLDPLAVQAEIGQYGQTPVEYIAGQAEFNSRLFQVSPDTLIPRVETETLLELTLAEISTTTPAPTQFKLIEVGTGSGALGISLVLELQQIWPTTQLDVWLTDVSAPALNVAKKNLATYFSPAKNLTPHLVRSDLMANIPAGVSFDLVVANLPYIPTARIETLDESVRKYEPHLALDGGPTGLEILTQLLHQLPPYLKPTTQVWLEIDHTHTQGQFAAIQPSFEVTIFPDQFGKTRFARVLPSSKST